ncbi:MAG TPA: ester cyclase [Nodosilinea sp.]|nr:ester cyclase [Nodosilinea sp.]
MSTESNRDLVLGFYQAFDNGTIEQALDGLAPNFVAHQAGMAEPLDAQGFRQFGLSFYTAFSEGKHVFNQVLAAGDCVVTCGTFTAIHRGSFQGLPPTGAPVSLAVMHIDRVADNAIVEHWGQGDALGLMQQLGMVVLPGPRLLSAALRQALAQRF